ncbi:MOSC domain-containing protein [Alkalihalobacillus sp. AL-G]|uniref:MOSC domain-containing protein n=1 Tax=Alkalihalobacillus sp. AL-G TaxID=2926399 RepID=UPI00272D4801|nr:MOSC domain-containing protein [Alkalihalobacillus sp. AL-G]WLD92747.1 MOSC domain-containing protein [Alkalihalobacillus sp. AL-G]
MGSQTINVESIHVGKPKTIREGNNPVKSAIFKQKVVSEKVYLSKLNFDGDEQADKINHGGLDKAICVYSIDHHPYWKTILNKQLGAGAFGENMSVQGVTEEDIYIGDQFRLGEAIVEVSQPRRPCFKLGIKWGEPKLAQYVQETGYSGFYFRVLQEGSVTSGDQLEKIAEHQGKVSIAYMNQIVYHDPENVEATEQLVQIDKLADSWRSGLIKRLDQLKNA